MSHAHASAPSVTMAPEWADYQEFARRHGDGRRVTDTGWGADDALDEYLVQMKRASLDPDRETRRRTLRNRISNRKQMYARRREILLGRYAAGVSTIDDTNAAAKAEVAERVAEVKEQTAEGDWHLLRALAQGSTYAILATQLRATVTGLKSRVSRCRQRLGRSLR